MNCLFYAQGEQAFDDIVFFLLTGGPCQTTMFIHNTRTKGKVYTQK